MTHCRDLGKGCYICSLLIFIINVLTEFNDVAFPKIFFALHNSWVSAFTCKKLIRRWDSERELFYDDILHVLQSTIDSCRNSGIDT